MIEPDFQQWIVEQIPAPLLHRLYVAFKQPKTIDQLWNISIQIDDRLSEWAEYILFQEKEDRYKHLSDFWIHSKSNIDE